MNTHVWILGVKGRYRGTELEFQLNSSNIEFSNLWSGDSTDNSLISNLKQTNKKFEIFAHGRPLTNGERACALGHLEIYSEFLNSDFEWALILEDDAVIIRNMDFLKYNLEFCPNPTIIGIHDGPGFRFPLGSANFQQQFFNKIKANRLLELPSCAYGYLINRRAVEIMDLNLAKNLMTVADWPYAWPSSFEYFATVEPFISTSGSEDNTLIGDRSNLSSQKISYWVPNLRRVYRAVNYGISFKEAFYREVYLKLLRIYYKLKSMFD